MKQALGTLAEGTVFKLYENGSLAEFIVAKQYSGYTMLVRRTILSEKRGWGLNGSSTSDQITWDDSTLKTWLEGTYASYLDPEVRTKLKTLTIRNRFNGTENVTIRVPGEDDLYGGFASAAVNLLKSITNIFWLTDTRSNTSTWTPSGGDPVTEEYGCAYYAYGSSHSTSGFYISYTEQENSYGVLPCFALQEGVFLGEDGILRANRVPEISSAYFGTESSHSRRSAFRLPYSVHDEDGDAVTVTEYLNDSVLRTYTAADGETNYLTVTLKMLDSLEAEIDQVLKVSATDGEDTAEKLYRFRKIVGSGYKVYIGKITGSADGTGYYWAERNLLHDAADESAPIVLEPELTLEGNEFGSLTFTIPKSNPHYEKIALKTAVISVEEDGNEIFMGRVTEWNKTFDLDMEVTCEGELSYLSDRDCVIEEKNYTSTELLTLAVTADSRFAKEGKAFNLGTVTKEKTGTDKDEKETRTIADCWSVAKDYLADKYGGYLRLRKTVTLENNVKVYRRYLDYMDMPPDRTDQIIRFGENLLDLSYDLRSNQIVNSIIVIGYETTGWFIFKSTNEIRVEVKNEDSIKEFGLCQRYMTVDGTKSTRDSLLKKGEEELKKNTDQFAGSITVNAADLADIGVDTDRLEFMKQARIISEAHGLANWVLCTKEVIPLDAPEEKEYTFGETSQNLSALQAKNFGTAGKAWNAIQSTIKYVKSGG